MLKFQKYYVTDGTIKARVSYSAHVSVSTGKPRVTLYAKSYQDGNKLAEIFGDEYENHTDSRSDHFEKGRVRILADNPLYKAALARAWRNPAGTRV